MTSDTAWGTLVWLADWIVLGGVVLLGAGYVALAWWLVPWTTRRLLALLGWIAAVWWAGGRPWGDLDPDPGAENDDA